MALVSWMTAKIWRWRHLRSALTRKEFAAEAGIAVTTLDYYIRRVNRSKSAEDASVSRIVPVELVTCEHQVPSVRGAWNAVVVRLGNGRSLVVHRGFDELYGRYAMTLRTIRGAGICSCLGIERLRSSGGPSSGLQTETEREKRSGKSLEKRNSTHSVDGRLS
ncbi:MAG: hypothetical protein KIT83_08485 [Bryobacterales bacterium]|nr:hypothetical protein [Bryobacterales bacterium]